MTLDQILFYKYQGAGNDFVIIDARTLENVSILSKAVIKKMCHRRFGVGADGLMVIMEHETADFKMKYYNSDGNLSSMCGNGGRCISHLFSTKSGDQERMTFVFDHCKYTAHRVGEQQIALNMQPVHVINRDESAYVLDTGSPHFVTFQESLVGLDVKSAGAKIRYSKRYSDEGINVNFCSWDESVLTVNTYERGVEDETLSCGTGVTAAAIALHKESSWRDGNYRIPIRTKGGNLLVQFEYEAAMYKNIQLTGPAILVFEGIMALQTETYTPS